MKLSCVANLSIVQHGSCRLSSLIRRRTATRNDPEMMASPCIRVAHLESKNGTLLTNLQTQLLSFRYLYIQNLLPLMYLDPEVLHYYVHENLSGKSRIYLFYLSRLHQEIEWELV